jgi:hypothetical protein
MRSRAEGIEDYGLEESKGNTKQNYYLSIFAIFTYEFGGYNIVIPLTTLTYHSVLLHCDMSTASSDSTLYRCEVCNKTFNSQNEIERHNKETHIETAGQKE